ncbi:MAG: lytic transglycosylase domain-containing protein [Myxococcota bacterium]|nr:lytic transglycosylase domain-containing protein [Myxococcota bacterium]
MLALLSAATLSALSCSFAAPARVSTTNLAAHAAPAGAEAELPHVSAPPADVEVAAAPDVDPDVRAVAEFLATRRTALTREETDALAEVIVQESRRHELDTQLVLALMHVESRFDAFALSPVGAMGIMQVMPSTGKEMAGKLGIPWHGAQTLFDPFVNVRVGVAYLKQLESRYADIPTALAAYNWGPGHIDRRLRRGRALPTQYPGLVLEAHETKGLRARS